MMIDRQIMVGLGIALMVGDETYRIQNKRIDVLKRTIQLCDEQIELLKIIVAQKQEIVELKGELEGKLYRHLSDRDAKIKTLNAELEAMKAKG